MQKEQKESLTSKGMENIPCVTASGPWSLLERRRARSTAPEGNKRNCIPLFFSLLIFTRPTRPQASKESEVKPFRGFSPLAYLRQLWKIFRRKN
jgi:hypothetical protein